MNMVDHCFQASIDMVDIVFAAVNIDRNCVSIL